MNRCEICNVTLEDYNKILCEYCDWAGPSQEIELPEAFIQAIKDRVEEVYG